MVAWLLNYEIVQINSCENNNLALPIHTKWRLFSWNLFRFFALMF